MKTMTLRQAFIPLIIALLVLVIFNIGLYSRLVANPAQVSPLTFPYSTDFSTEDWQAYQRFGGDWSLRDQTLVQMSPTGDDLGIIIPLAISAEQAYQHSTQVRWLGGTFGGGILFNLQQTATRQQSHMARFFVQEGRLSLLYGYYGDDSNFTGQGNVGLALSPTSDAWQTLAVQVQGDVYQLLVNGQVVASQIPLVYQGGSVGLITSTSQVAFDDVQVTPLEQGFSLAQANPVPTTNPEPAEVATASPLSQAAPLLAETFDNPVSAESLWRPFSGEWLIENGNYTQRQTEGFDLGTGYDARFSDYTLRVSFRHLQGVGGGVLFAMPAANSKNGAHMARYIDERFLTWGYFDAQGAYVGQGSAELDAPADALQTLEIIVSEQRYAIRLNTKLIAQDIPLQNQLGGIGLVTSQSVVAFESVEVLSNTNPLTAPETPQDAVLDLRGISGTWTTQDGITTQQDAEARDYIAGVGVSAESFTLSVDIQLPDVPDLADAGGGVVFHMAGRDDPKNGHMVRLAQGAKEIFWGKYNADGVFIGEGGVPLNLEPSPVYRLSVIVRSDTYDISVNGQTIVQAVPLQGSAGWIGLISFRGGVSFSNIALQVGGL